MSAPTEEEQAAARDARKNRRSKRGQLGRAAGLVVQRIEEGDNDQVEAALAELKSAFDELSEACVSYETFLTKEADLDVADAFLEQARGEYITTLKKGKSHLKGEDDTNKGSAMSNKGGLSGIASLLAMPKLDVGTYNGNPIEYTTFMKVFVQSVKGIDDDEIKLIRLLDCTTGAAKRAIQPCVFSDDGYQKALGVLKKRFGDSALIVEATLGELHDSRPAKTPAEIRQLSDDLRNGYNTLLQLKSEKELDTRSFMHQVVMRLPSYMQNKWRIKAVEHREEKGRYPGIKELMKYIASQAEIANDPMWGERRLAVKPTARQTDRYAVKKTVHTNQALQTTSRARKTWPCKLCNEDHKLWDCAQFKTKTPRERLAFVEQKKLCHNCLYDNHTTSECKRGSRCGVPGCGAKHTKFLHVSDELSQNTGPLLNTSRQSMTVADSKRRLGNAAAGTEANGGSVHMPVLGVMFDGGASTFALLDTGSNATFCTEEIALLAGVNRRQITYSLDTLNRQAEKKCSWMVDLSIKGEDGALIQLANVFVVRTIPLQTATIDIPHLRRYQHLQGIVLPKLPRDIGSRLGLLIGQDNSSILLPLEVRSGKSTDPFAVRCRLGWTLSGPAHHKRHPKEVMSHFVNMSDVELSAKIDHMWNADLEGTDASSLEYSQEERGVKELWDKTAHFKDGHFVLPIPFKRGIVMPSNQKLAKKRLETHTMSLQRRSLFDAYDKEIKKLLHDGHAEKVNDKMYSDRTWYLPHQAVITEKKPGKLRPVFDCAARYQGECLNDKVHKGPDMSNQLLSVLLRFRRFQWAFTADIKAMYYQTVVPEEHRDALRFLWWDEDGNESVFRMTRHVFGGVWSAGAATYALKRIVNNSKEQMQDVSEVIDKSFYIDDCAHSAESIEEARRLARDVKQQLQGGGFHLTKFISNSPEVLEDISADDIVKDDSLTDRIYSHTLGMKWNTKDDTICFGKRDWKLRIGPVNKRQMLSSVASIFDPLGLLNPLMIRGKLLLQEATRRRLTWDEAVSADLQADWDRWTSCMSSELDVKLRRRMVTGLVKDQNIELHMFSDSSSVAYGCCAYIQTVSKEGKVEVNLLCGKSRVSPLRSRTIPRLELQAAVLSAKLSRYIQDHMGLSMSKVTYWTDSEIVLRYIQNDTKKLHVFVANRISTICSLTDIQQWKHVASEWNPADLLTRGATPGQLKTWWYGPAFLRKYRSQWPTDRQIGPALNGQDPEVKKAAAARVTSHASEVNRDHTEYFLRYFSSWKKLKVMTAWLLRFREYLQRKSVSTEPRLTIQELQEAEKVILRYVQAQTYGDEVANLHQGRPVSKSSTIRDLCPILQDKVMKVGGRLAQGQMSAQVKHPAIIPARHHVATLITRHYHQQGHVGREWTVSKIREAGYWITQPRKVARQVLQQCFTCKRLYANPCKQKMADLPLERMDGDHPPFSYVGVDCFGPYLVKQGRSSVKRYGCLFTCLTTRAVHLEKLTSIDADSYINAVRRFSARRGMPEKIWSDNGTNFVGARTEIDRAMKDMDKTIIEKYGLENGVAWHFNSPAAPHTGGVWERLIGVIKRVLNSMLLKTSLNDEILDTLLCEAESIVNSRPITKVSSDPQDLAALTPNHLLMLKDAPGLAWGDFNEKDQYRRRWRHAQYIADQFWRKWKVEYLLEMQRRNKWHHPEENVKIGDLVLIQDLQTHRNLWPLGRVESVSTGDDGLVRSAIVKTQQGTLKRPIQRLIMLDSRTV